MSKQGFANNSSDVYVYQELTGVTSGAIGLDNADSGKLKLHVINGPGAMPDASSQIIIDPTTNVVTIPSLSATITYPWNEITAVSATLAINNGYITNRGTLVTLALPATAAQGSMIYITGKGAGGWSISQSAGQSINFGGITTTIGVGGSLSSSQQFDSILLVCITANTTYNVVMSIGNLTYV